MLRFDLSACSHLQIFELRLERITYFFRDLVLWLASVVNTITSPVFSRFVLVADSGNPHPLFRKFDERSAWDPADQAFLCLSQRVEMKMVVKRRVLSEPFRDVMEGAFPLMASAGLLEFETNDSPLCSRCLAY